jgi:hypothetical protein
MCNFSKQNIFTDTEKNHEFYIHLPHIYCNIYIYIYIYIHNILQVGNDSVHV